MMMQTYSQTQPLAKILNSCEVIIIWAFCQEGTHVGVVPLMGMVLHQLLYTLYGTREE